MSASTYNHYRRVLAGHERSVVAAWLTQLPAAGWVGTANELAAEFALVADALGHGYPPTPGTAANRLVTFAPSVPGWIVTQRRTNSARLIVVRPA